MTAAATLGLEGSTCYAILCQALPCRTTLWPSTCGKLCPYAGALSNMWESPVGNCSVLIHKPCAVICIMLCEIWPSYFIRWHQMHLLILINQSKRKTSYAKRSLRTNQHTTPADEQKSHNPMPANHMDTPRTGEPLRPHKTLQHRVEARCNGVHTKRAI